MEEFNFLEKIHSWIGSIAFWIYQTSPYIGEYEKEPIGGWDDN